MRLFYAVKIPEEVKDVILSYSSNYKQYEGIKIQGRSLLHITMLFMGEVNRENLEDIDSIARSLEEIDFSTRICIDSAGVFPNKIFPNIIWAGSRRPDEKLICLSDAMKNRFGKYTGKQKSKKFTPHVTVCRIKKPQENINILEFKENICFDIEGFSLFDSTLTPRGPVYNELNSYKFIRSSD